jgi:hypothetical protein
VRVESLAPAFAGVTGAGVQNRPRRFSGMSRIMTLVGWFSGESQFPAV